MSIRRFPALHLANPGKLQRMARLVRRFAPLLAPHRRSLALGGLYTAGFTLTGLLAPWPIQMVVDGVLLDRRNRGLLAWAAPILPASAAGLLALACVAVLAIAMANGLLSFGQRVIVKSVGHRVIADLRLAVFSRLQRLSLGFHHRWPTGDLLMRMTGDVAMLREMLVPAVLDGTSRILVLVGMLGLMAWMDPLLTLVAAAMLPALGVVTLRFGSRIRGVVRKQRRKEGRIASVAGEALASVALVQAFSQETEIVGRFTTQNRRSLRAGLKSLRLQESLQRIVEMTLAAGTCAVLWIGGHRAMRGVLSPGELIVFLSYLKGLYGPVQALARIASRSSKALACADRVVEVLDSEEEVINTAGAVEARDLRGEVVFDRVIFGYDPQRPVLREVSFRVAPGERIGLVGPSGSGKSTILALLLRLQEPQGGRILVDGRDIRDFLLGSYRRQIAVVLQDPFLFGISVAENIRLARPEAGDGEVEAAATAVEAHGFVADLPEGYDTVLGERGTSLSRGQQQRLALARAVLRRSPILAFDEPTTGLDGATEREVVRTLARVGEGRTCLWIAHHLEQILGCERVLVLQDGRIVEEGAPAALMDEGGALRALVRGARR